jgi:hypothetical protein
MTTIDFSDLQTVPPALVLMLREFAREKDWGVIRKNIRSALRDITSGP